MRVGVGLASLGRPAYINVGRAEALPGERSVGAMRAACWSVLDAAYARGVRWVDVARSYGLAEEFLAGWMGERGVADVTVSSKWGYAYTGEWRTDAEVHEVKEHSLARFRAQWAESRALLGGRIALYQVHSLTVDSPLFGDEALLAALAGLAEGGMRVGFSTSGPAQAEVVDRGLALRVAGRPVFTAVQSTWNVLEPSVGPALRRAREAGIHVLVKETLANGRLAVTPPAELAGIADRHGVTPDAVAIAAALAQPWADTVLLGPASTAQLASNLAAADLTLTRADLDRLNGLAEPAAGYWATRQALAWH
ncbi:MAG TPA: aldo/keto reductase [Actinophytocola sp.]|uniref:aldo/keto reductase n=1 Tax=Actinophytocola sp. TaxID=1872138 RepID=UPI002DBCA757|nr:aldo/keto reductase [Actinophytocola sp.]HEU5474953.1 aldo/keto reductase [Actinophytocola sp.]